MDVDFGEPVGDVCVSDAVVLPPVEDSCGCCVVMSGGSATRESTVVLVPVLTVVIFVPVGGEVCPVHAVNVSANRSIRHSSCIAFIVSPLLTGYHVHQARAIKKPSQNGKAFLVIGNVGKSAF